MTNVFIRGSLIFLLAFGLFPAAALAADLFLSPSSGNYRVGELFSALVNVNTKGESINAAEGQLNFDNQRLEVETVGYSRSIFTLWTQEPSFSNAGGVIRFSGGLPSPGFNGASGSILRVTFRTKTTGQAPVVFVSGSVLANDGKGTNILDNLRGALFNIVSGAPPKPPEEKARPLAPSFEPAEKLPSVPLITDWPRSLEAGQTLTVRGLGFPSAKILVSVQKGSADPVIEETFAGADGRFSFTYSKTVESGFYRVWAKNVSPEGAVSPSSEIVTIEVVAPLFFRIGTVAINYATVIVTLIALLLLLVIMMLWIWWRFRKWQEKAGVEISEAEKALHDGFEKLQSGLRRYLSYLTAAKSPENIRKRELKTQAELEAELKGIESGIEKEIEDIKKPKRKKKDE